LAIAEIVRVTMAARHQGEHRHHVGGDFWVHSPQRGQIEAAAVRRVPPTQQEFGRHSALPGVGLRDFYESLQGCLLPGRNSSTHAQISIWKPAIKSECRRFYLPRTASFFSCGLLPA